MRRPLRSALALFPALIAAAVLTRSLAGQPPPHRQRASVVVTVSKTGPFVTTVLMQTHAVAVKETGPKATVAKFGEVYAWSPTFFAVRQNQPTRIRFWNLQPDDYHTFELLGSHSHKLALLTLPPLSDTSYVFTFHRPGLYSFRCTIHEPDMVGQILVLPASE